MASEGLLRRLRHVAKIIGSASAAQRALDEYEQRRAVGEDVTIFEHRSSLVVGPLAPTGDA